MTIEEVLGLLYQKSNVTSLTEKDIEDALSAIAKIRVEEEGRLIEAGEILVKLIDNMKWDEENLCCTKEYKQAKQVLADARERIGGENG